MVKGIFDESRSHDEPENHFTIGIIDAWYPIQVYDYDHNLYYKKEQGVSGELSLLD